LKNDQDCYGALARVTTNTPSGENHPQDENLQAKTFDLATKGTHPQEIEVTYHEAWLKHDHSLGERAPFHVGVQMLFLI
jgi:hypothetical protein